MNTAPSTNQALAIFLLVGQSNMAGRGKPGEVPPLQDPGIFMFRKDEWILAEEPLHTDKPEVAGIGLGMSFAAHLRSIDPASVGLVPCAVGGTPLSRWMPGADLYENAVSTTRRALVRGTLRGILWHQGEGDSGTAEDADSYGTRFREMISALREDLSAPGIPVMAGELGGFLRDNPGVKHFPTINRQLRQLEHSLPDYGCVSAAGLTDNGDHLHFNAESLRAFGIRYAEKYLETRDAQHFRPHAGL